MAKRRHNDDKERAILPRYGEDCLRSATSFLFINRQFELMRFRVIDGTLRVAVRIGSKGFGLQNLSGLLDIKTFLVRNPDIDKLDISLTKKNVVCMRATAANKFEVTEALPLEQIGDGNKVLANFEAGLHRLRV